MDELAKVKKTASDIVKENPGALIGALIGWFISDSEKAKSVLMGAIAGSVLKDKKGKTDGDEE